VKPYVGAVPLTKLSSLDLQKFYNKLKTSGRIQTNHALPNPGLSSKTVRSVHTLLHSCLDQAVREKFISSNPADGCSPPPKEKSEMKILPPEQIGRFLQEADKAGYLAMFYLELTSGLRRGELLALLWSDVDAANRTVSVSKQVIRVNGVLKILPPKTKNAVRKIVVPQQTIDLLLAEHERHPDNQLLFPSPKTEGHLDPPAVARKLKTLLARAGIDEIRFHDLRHTFATVSLQSGVNVKALSHNLGHYSAGFTLDTYTHVTTQMQADAAEKIGGFMAKI
jgi:integrase